MPRYFFDVHDGHIERDQEGTVCDDTRAAAHMAKRLLPEIVLNEVPKDSERQSFTVLVTDEQGHPVYSAVLCFVGTWLSR
ncbi:MAG: hypothetical protein K2Y56_02660 [Methylobacterium sp.]|uniref:DUF6894 family protein n=1 Tax=Methylobacterium sp. TaxID=409 RepID=UPI0025F9557C|nr:hypothetical protein [Methylobacterium sp.]MBX9930433.1 hypothetical protein [Methylobacterium sp.]